MLAFVLLTAWFVQRGSAESKPEHDDTDHSVEHRNDPRRAVAGAQGVDSG